MGLTDGMFVWGTIIGAVVAFAALVVLWSRLAPRRWWMYPLRALSMLLVISLALMGAFARANQKNLWYASWQDLLDPQIDADSHEVGATPHMAAAQDVGPWGPATHVASYGPNTLERVGKMTERNGGRWITTPVRGELSGHTAPVTVWVPDSYFTPEGAHRAYPVLMFMHGFPGTTFGILRDFGLERMVNTAVKAGHMRESILVIPALNPGGVDSECVDSHQVKMETWISTDVPAWVAARLRVERGRTSWALDGFSAGGYCSSMLALRHPDTFSAGISMAGYFRPDFGSKAYYPFGPGSPEWRKYDLVRLIAQQPPAVALWVQSSQEDGKTYQRTQEFISKVRSPLAVESVVLKSAGHRYGVWRELTPQALQWLGETVPGFSQGPR